jgi:hypothetical protein
LQQPPQLRPSARSTGRGTWTGPQAAIHTLHSSALCPRKLQRLHAGLSRCSVLFFQSFLFGRIKPFRAVGHNMRCARVGAPPAIGDKRQEARERHAVTRFNRNGVHRARRLLLGRRVLGRPRVRRSKGPQPWSVVVRSGNLPKEIRSSPRKTSLTCRGGPPFRAGWPELLISADRAAADRCCCWASKRPFSAPALHQRVGGRCCRAAADEQHAAARKCPVSARAAEQAPVVLESRKQSATVAGERRLKLLPLLPNTHLTQLPVCFS